MNVGSVDNTFAYTLTGATKPGNYTLDVTEGTLTITKAKTLTVGASDVTEQYDGVAYGVTPSANFPGGTVIYYATSYSADPAAYTLLASPAATHVDESKTVYFVAVNGNYEPAFGNAKITITPREVTVTGATQSKTYDGTALENADVTLGGDGFLTGEGYETLPVATGTVTDAGFVTNPVSGGTLNADTQAHDYAITTIAGTLTVYPAALTVQANNQQISYPADRPATSALSYTLVGGNVADETPAYGGALGYKEGLADDPLIPATYYDAIVKGTLALADDGTFKAANYTLTVLPGDLKVINGDFDVTLTGGSWTYTGDLARADAGWREPDGYDRILQICRRRLGQHRRYTADGDERRRRPADGQGGRPARGLRSGGEHDDADDPAGGRRRRTRQGITNYTTAARTGSR